MTVAVIELIPQYKFKLLDKDIKIEITRDSGAGGQHRNVTDSCVVMTHIPTGIKAKAAAKCQHENRKTARSVLESRVEAHLEEKRHKDLSNLRLSQVGSGMRGDKIRTYREKDDMVTDHRTEKKCKLSMILKGEIERIL